FWFNYNNNEILIYPNIYYFHFFIFFFQAEDGIRDFHVTGVQTCALPISATRVPMATASGTRKSRARISQPTKEPTPVITVWRIGPATSSARMMPSLMPAPALSALTPASPKALLMVWSAVWNAPETMLQRLRSAGTSSSPTHLPNSLTAGTATSPIHLPNASPTGPTRSVSPSSHSVMPPKASLNIGKI